ncbi:hypothetical protein AB1Y20_006699 [Prymnesium parvum]|uniref:Uncharacterized protein n=1 Tax=Prymnesium parvum TaxID=97485 RepID=A0AB34J0K7_PRYPA
MLSVCLLAAPHRRATGLPSSAGVAATPVLFDSVVCSRAHLPAAPPRWPAPLRAGRVVASAAPALLGDVPTPALVVDADALPAAGADLDRLGRLLRAHRADAAAAAELRALLSGTLYLHARVVRRAPRRTRYHREATYPLCTVDLPSAGHVDGGAYLCCGLNNHYDASYYWARSAGGGSRLSAPGVALWPGCDGLVEIVRVGAADIPAGQQTNDGKRSEWCEFLNVGDEVDIVPADALKALASMAAGGSEVSIVAITRKERPPGAEPSVLTVLRA